MRTKKEKTKSTPKGFVKTKLKFWSLKHCLESKQIESKMQLTNIKITINIQKREALCIY